MDGDDASDVLQQPRSTAVPLLDISNLSVTFRQYDKGLRQSDLQVISNLSMSVSSGEMLAIVGSSGSGKSLLAHAILGILPQNATVAGQMLYRSEALDARRQTQLRGKHIAFVPQSVEYLDPLMKVGSQVRGTRGTAQQQQTVFARYGLADTVTQMYPFQLSGGMARRVLVSTAVIEDADLIIADEPTPGLTHGKALDALQSFRELADHGSAVILITHDLDLAYSIADTIAVFYAGTTLEVASAQAFKEGPKALHHPYSKALWRALPQHDFAPIAGSQPYAGNLPPGCLFYPRCDRATQACAARAIEMQNVSGGEVRCLHAS